MLNDSWNEFYKAFEFTENVALSRICRAIFFRSLFFPLLSDWDVVDRKAIGIVYDDENVPGILSRVLCFNSDHPIIFSINEPKRNWEKKLVENSGDIIIFRYDKGPQAEVNIHLLNDMLQTGYIDGEAINALAIVCYRGFVPSAQRHNYFNISVLKGEIVESRVKKFSDKAFEEIMDFAVKKQAVFEWEVGKFCDELKNGFITKTEKTLKAATVIFKVYLSELYGIDKAENEFEHMLKTIEEYSKHDEEEQDGEGIGDVFVALFLSVTKNHDIRVYAKDAVALDYCDTTRYVIYDENFYYVNEEFFKEICGSLLDTVGIGMIKNQLTEENLIIPNQTVESFTVKVALCFPYGNVERKRLLRLNREKIDRPGVPDLTMRGDQNGRVDDRKSGKKRCPCVIIRNQSACTDYRNVRGR